MTTDDASPEPPSGQPTADRATGRQYEVRVQGRLGARRAAWFEGMALTDGADGTTVIRGPVVDQAALHGLIAKLRDLGVTLLSLTCLGPDATSEDPGHPHDPTRPTSGARP